LKLTTQQRYAVQKSFGCAPTPAHEDPAHLERYWGERWGCADDVGRLRLCLLGRPAEDRDAFADGRLDPESGAIVDPKGLWYFYDQDRPDVALLREQHDGLTRALRDEGVTVDYVETPRDGRCLNALFVRDVAAVIPGGAIISRMGPLMRRGEEQRVAAKLASLGVPILRTIHGTGTMECGSFVILDRKNAVVGESCRVNAEGCRQLAETLAIAGMNTIVVPLSGYSLHIDGSITMVDHQICVAKSWELPFWFLERLSELKIRVIDASPEDDYLCCNCIAVRPGRVILTRGAERTAEALVRAGVEVVMIEFGEVKKGGGSVHCATLPVLREWE
jgi:N-dimethylarginine dimethylaminohydrolase